MTDLVSIIIPVYNAEIFLEKCIKSVLAQTYTNFELILVYDKSSDLSGEICKEFAEKDNRIIFKQLSVKRGVSYARNQGLKLAKGKYVSFVDADDFIEPDFLSKLLTLLKVFNCEMSGCAIVKAKHNIQKAVKQKTPCITILNNIESLQNIFACKLFYFGSVWNKLFVREIIGDLKFDENIFYGEDLLFVYNYIKKCEKCVHTNQKLYHYVKNPQGYVRSKFNESKLTVLNVLEQIIADCKINKPQLLNYARGLYCMLNLEIFYYTLKYKYRSKLLRKQLKFNMIDNLKQLTKTKLFHVHRRTLVPIAIFISKFIV